MTSGTIRPGHRFRALGGLLFLAACGSADDDLTASLTPPTQEPAPPAAFAERADCRPLGAYAGPPVGSTYIYRRADGSHSSREILSSADGRTAFRYLDLSVPGQRPLPPRAVIAGMFVVHDAPSGNRALHYDRAPLAALTGLHAGETASIPTVETSTLKGRTRRVAFQTTVAYRACGDLTVDGQPMPVSVYEVGSARRVIDRRSGDQVRQSHVTYYLSDRTGFPLAFQDETTTVAVRIDQPGLPTP